MSRKSSGFKTLFWSVLVVAVLVAAYCVWSLLFTGWLGAKQIVDPATLLSLGLDGSKRDRGRMLLTACVPLAGLGLLAFTVFYKPLKLYGDARFGNAAEFKTVGLASKVGVILGRGFGTFAIAPSPGNVLVCAPPGGGKSAGIAIPTLLTWAGSMLALDTKLELYQATAGLRKRAGQRVFVFAPLMVKSHRFNPLATLQAGPLLVDAVDRIANFLIPTEKEGDPWPPEARALFIGVALHIFTSTGRVSIGDVYVFCRDVESTWDKCARLIEAGEVTHPDARQLLGDFASKPPKEASGVKSTLTGALGLWGNPVVRAATAESDFDFSDMRRHPTTVYVGVAPPDLVRIEKLLAMLYQQMMDALCRELPGKDEPHEVLMMLDEFAAAGNMPLVKKGLAFLRGYKVRVCLIIQSPAQLEEIYGPAGKKTIMDTCGYRLFFEPNDQFTAQDISRELGNRTVKTRTRNVSMSGTSRNYTESKRELLLPDEVMRLGGNRSVLFAQGSRPFLLTKVRYFEDARFIGRAAVEAPSIPALQFGPVSQAAIDEAALLDAATLELLQLMSDDAATHGMDAEAQSLAASVELLLATMDAETALLSKAAA